MQFFNYFLLQKYDCVQPRKQQKFSQEIMNMLDSFSYWLLKVTSNGKEQKKMNIDKGMSLK